MIINLRRFALPSAMLAMVGLGVVALAMMSLVSPRTASATDVMPFTGVYGDEAGCSRYFGAPMLEGIAVDRAGVEGNEWFCTWYAISFQRDARTDEWGEVFRVDAVCFTEGEGRFVKGEVMRNTGGSRLRIVLPDIYPDADFPSCRAP
jgi:hypothetical protein